MKKNISYKTVGTCSKQIDIIVNDDIIEDVKFTAGCDGNTTAVEKLVKGMNTKDAILKLKGIKCGYKVTSCPDQLASALEKLANQN